MDDKESYEKHEPSQNFAIGEFSVLAALLNYLFSPRINIVKPEKETTVLVDDLLSEDGQAYVRSFLEKYSDDYSNDDFDKLHKLLELKDYELDKEQLKTILVLLGKESKYLIFQEILLMEDHSDIRKCLRIFVKFYNNKLRKMKEYRVACQKHGIRFDVDPAIANLLGAEVEPRLYTGEHTSISMNKVHTEVKEVSEKVYYLKRFLSEKNEPSNMQNDEDLIEGIMNELEIFELEKFENNLNKKEKYTIEEIDAMDGYKFERMLAWLFEKMGYIVKHTNLSNDQGADLVLEKLGQILVVQAKRYENKISNSAVQEVVASIKHYKARSGIVITNNMFTNSAIELAKSNGIELIDRIKLKALLSDFC